jgi:hypothetical protein
MSTTLVVIVVLRPLRVVGNVIDGALMKVKHKVGAKCLVRLFAIKVGSTYSKQ